MLVQNFEVGYKFLKNQANHMYSFFTILMQCRDKRPKYIFVILKEFILDHSSHDSLTALDSKNFKYNSYENICFNGLFALFTTVTIASYLSCIACMLYCCYGQCFRFQQNSYSMATWITFEMQALYSVLMAKIVPDLQKTSAHQEGQRTSGQLGQNDGLNQIIH